jgi:hypothetical protein
MKSFLHRNPDIGAKVRESAAPHCCDLSGVCHPIRPEPLKRVRFSSSGIRDIGLLAIGAFSLGALAVGALAVGKFFVGKLFIGSARLKSLDIGKLNVRSCDCGGEHSPDGASRGK